MELIEKYKKLSYSIVKSLDIDITQYYDEFESTYLRMLEKYTYSKPDEITYRFVFEELFDSVTDIIYYLCDYINTLKYNNQEIEEAFIIFSEDETVFKYYMDKVCNFSTKACKDYEFFTEDKRLLDRSHIDEMVVSEIFEFISILMIFFSKEQYDSDYDMFQHSLTIIDSCKTEDMNIFECLCEFLNYEIYSDIIFGSSITCNVPISSLFNSVHTKNMLKIFKEDNRFHFRSEIRNSLNCTKMKVSKPDHWKQEIDNDPDLFDPKSEHTFSESLDIICNDLDIFELHE